MQNLAGNPNCDKYIECELNRCGIEIIKNEANLRNEVPATIEGKLGKFRFVRAWYYWMVDGPVPLDIAGKLYSDPVGKTDIRVMGHCGCPSPDEWAHDGFIHSYHIDSELGLRIFADAIRGVV